MSKYNDAPEERDRVKTRIGSLVRQFYKPGKVFHLKELTDFVTDGIGIYIAPTSPYRIMALMRQQNELNYKVLSRSQSLYEFTNVKPEANEQLKMDFY